MVTRRQEGATDVANATERSPSTVPGRANHDGETPGPYAWAEPTIWTPRMVQALQSGVKGGRWYSVIDKVLTLRSLEAAFARVKANKGGVGVDHMTIEAFERDKARHLTTLHESLRDGTYRPSPIRRCYIPKAGSKELRPLGVPTVRDRVVQTALRAALEPIFEREFADHSYGFRPQRSAKMALQRVDSLLRQGLTWVVDVDLKSYFDTVPHAPLMTLVKRRIADGRALDLIEAFLRQPIQEEGRRWIPTVGTPQGAVVSPLLSNLYLDPLDHHMARMGFEMTRYADDFVIQCSTEEAARRALEEVTRWCGDAGLTVHPTKTRLVQVSGTEGIDFLGYHFRLHRDDPWQTKRWPRKKSVAKLRDTLRPLTRRLIGISLGAVIGSVNRVLRGFFQYFRACIQTSLAEIDRWVRGRLRSLLRKRRKGRGRARGLDMIRWPNAFFRTQGLFSLAGAHAEAAHSPRG